ncbi:hypothetical protein BBW65_05245 [Helicobacter enhydrae]|uniref:Uncharacterized protein n=1 Tax=Helicobacter enhydrae TaxID=222136 RepID=A0A1B1U4N5_9HELI|nr:hypothetical protein BBW65_02520 [Helicobacter enhydrae]ANV98236.1 hypothetical protein BBW65_05245 [Helicobacter enhydrae]
MCKSNLEQDFIKFEKPRIRASFKLRFNNKKSPKEHSPSSQLAKKASKIPESPKSMFLQN